MSRIAKVGFQLGTITLLVCATVAPADDFDLDWYTIDGGGNVLCAGGDFELSGTVAQPDASATVLAGGDFELTGGFWKLAWRAPDRRVVPPTDSEPLDQDYEQVDEQPLPSP